MRKLFQSIIAQTEQSETATSLMVVLLLTNKQKQFKKPFIILHLYLVYLTQCDPLRRGGQGVHQPSGGVSTGGAQARHPGSGDLAPPGDVHQRPRPGHSHHRQARPDLSANANIYKTGGR